MRNYILGGGPGDASEVKSHPFFTPINWDDLLRKNLPAPFIPKIGSPTDVSNFSDEFTTMAAVDSPGVVPPNGAEKLFRGYSFVAPSVMFAENKVVDEEVFVKRPDPDKRPSTSNLVACILQVSHSLVLIIQYIVTGCYLCIQVSRPIS